MNKKKNGFAATGILYTILLIFLALMTTLLVTLSSRSKVLEKLKQNAKEEVGIDILGIPSKDYARGDIVSYLGYNWKVIDDNGDSSKLILNRYLTQSELKDNLPDDVNDSIISSNTVPMCLSTSSSKYCNCDSNSTAYTWNTSIVKPIVQNWINYEMEENGLNIEKELVGMSFNDGVETINDYIKIPNYNETIYSKTVDGGTQTVVYNGETVTFDAISGCLYSLLPANEMSNSLVASLDRRDSMMYIVFPTNNTNGYYCLENPPQRYICHGSQIVPIITVKETYYTKSNKIIYDASFDYTGDVQTFTVPYTGTYKIELWGAQGNGTSSYPGGNGGYTSGNISLRKNEKLYIYVGSQSGYNGGGSQLGSPGYSGGGATDVRLTSGTWSNFDSLKSRIMVAAGGGGAQTYFSSLSGGYAGGTTGGAGKITGSNGLVSSGATQTGVGTGGGGSCTPTAPAFGKGGTGCGTGGGGGGGYYGAYAGTHGSTTVGSGGGGSSFISGYSGCKAISSDSTSSSITHLSSAKHYSGYVFSSTVMKAGNQSMPTHDGSSTMTGNSGNGYAKVTFLD